MYCGWLNCRGVPIFVVFVEGPIHEFQYPRISNFLSELWRKILWPRNFEPLECVNFEQSTKIGTYKNKAVHSKYIAPVRFTNRISVFTFTEKELVLEIERLKRKNGPASGKKGKTSSKLDAFIRSVEEERNYYKDQTEALQKMLRGEIPTRSRSPVRSRSSSRAASPAPATPSKDKKVKTDGSCIVTTIFTKIMSHWSQCWFVFLSPYLFAWPYFRKANTLNIFKWPYFRKANTLFLFSLGSDNGFFGISPWKQQRKILKLAQNFKLVLW